VPEELRIIKIWCTPFFGANQNLPFTYVSQTLLGLRTFERPKHELLPALLSLSRTIVFIIVVVVGLPLPSDTRRLPRPLSPFFPFALQRSFLLCWSFLRVCLCTSLLCASIGLGLGLLCTGRSFILIFILLLLFLWLVLASSFVLVATSLLLVFLGEFACLYVALLLRISK
jgi:hypothetical protein